MLCYSSAWDSFAVRGFLFGIPLNNKLFPGNKIMSPLAAGELGSLQGSGLLCQPNHQVLHACLWPLVHLVLEHDFRFCVPSKVIVIVVRLKYHSPEVHCILNSLKFRAQRNTFGKAECKL